MNVATAAFGSTAITQLSEPRDGSVPANLNRAGRWAGQSVAEELLRQHTNRSPRRRAARMLCFSPLDANERSWLRAAEAEITVGKILDRLPADYSVYYSFPLRNTAFWIDHLVVGPGGIFSLNSKTRGDRDLTGSPRTIVIDGRPLAFLRDAHFEAAHLTTLLGAALPTSLPVRPVTVLVNTRRIQVRARPDSLTVIDSPRLRRWIVGQPPVLSSEQQDAIRATICAPALQASGVSSPGAAQVRNRYTLLKREVAAVRTRRTWLFAGAATIVTAALAAGWWPALGSAMQLLIER